MDKLRVAVVVEENILPSEGGGYSYYQRMVREIDLHQFPEEIEMLYLVSSNHKVTYHFAKPVIVSKRSFSRRTAIGILDKMYRLAHRLYKSDSKRILEFFSRVMSRLKNSSAIQCLRANGVDLVYYLKPNDYPMDFPMIVTHWDVGHKSMYPFPEVAADGNYRKRESYYINMLNRALLILCESKSGAEELIHYYPINSQKVKILPLFGGEIVNLRVPENKQEEILHLYSLQPGKFFIYPAQFWAHKNHFNLVMAFDQLLKTHGDPELRLVLCGADQGNMRYIKKVIDSLGLNERVIITGFVQNDALYTFYQHAISLVMPTYLGPTNIPLIEAAMLHCPVICSDLKGHHEMLDDTALYFNPSSASEIAACMSAVMDEKKRNGLKAAAFERINKSTFHVSKSINVLQKILQEIRPVRKAWGKVPALLQVLTYANIGLMTF